MTVAYNDIVSGVYPERRLYYLPQLGQTYSSTYGMVMDPANYNSSQDLLAENWVVNGTIKTKDEVIGQTTDAVSGQDQALLNFVPLPTASNTLDIWNAAAVDLVADTVANGLQDPCSNTAKLAELAAAGTPVDKLCDALVANDEAAYLNSIDYPFTLCHSPQDEVIPYENQDLITLPNSQGQGDKQIVNGDHDLAGQLCIQNMVEFFVSIYC